MQSCKTFIRAIAVACLALPLSGCDDPQVYGSIGAASGYSSYGQYGYRGSGSRMYGSISVGGRMR